MIGLRFVLLGVALGTFLAGTDMAYLDVDTFFNVNGNLTRVTWAHAVNNRTLLQQALNSSVMMLEADVVIGNLTGTNSTNIPIMAHPPSTTSDLSLQLFMSTLASFNAGNNTSRKGVKLDFKSIEAFEGSLLTLTYTVPQLNCPVWLNADIFSGPVNTSTVPVNASRFFAVARVISNTTLSVGWTTNYGPGINTSYTSAQINNMISSISSNNVTQAITFPVRAGIAAESIPQMQTLINNVNGSTITIWSSDNDPVDVAHLRNLIGTIGENKTYIDVPDSLKNQLYLDSPSSVSASGSLLMMLVLCLVVNLV